MVSGQKSGSYPSPRPQAQSSGHIPPPSPHPNSQTGSPPGTADGQAPPLGHVPLPATAPPASAITAQVLEQSFREMAEYVHADIFCFNSNTFTTTYCSGYADYCCGGSCCSTFTTGIIIAIVLGAIFGIIVLAVTILAIVKTCCKTETGRVIQPQPHSNVFVTSGQSGYPQYPAPTAGAAFGNPGPAPRPTMTYPPQKANVPPNPPPYYPPPGGQDPPSAAPQVPGQVPPPAVSSYPYYSPGTAQLPGQAQAPVVATNPGQGPPPVAATDPGQAPPPATAPVPSSGNGS